MKKWSLIDKAFLLKRSTPFVSLDLDILLTFADKLTLVTFEEGEQIFPIEQEAHRMYFIGKGDVCLKNELGDALNLSSPEYFGEEALFIQQPRTYEAIAITDVTLFSLSRTHLFMMMSEAPVVAHRFLELYAKELSNQTRFQFKKGGTL